jgi:chorismate synthase
MSIPGIKAVEVGDGFASASRFGTEAHDEILVGEGGDGVVRDTNRAGGIEGGISNGSIIRVRAAQKPLSTLMRPLRSIDVKTKEAADAFRERSDVCSVPAAGVVAEQMVAIVLAAETQRVYGGDTRSAFVDAHHAHLARLAAY